MASGSGYTFNGQKVLRRGDVTTACPMCGQEGVIVEGSELFLSFGQPVAEDGSLVKCGCPTGSNRVVAPLTGPMPSGRSLATARAVAAPTTRSLGAADSGLESGFHIVQRSMSFEEVLASLAMQKPLPLSSLQRLNPTFADGFKAGKIFVLGSPSSEFTCSLGETELIMVAEEARASLAIL